MSEYSDLDYMQRAIALAQQGQYSTKPNPNVGCVIVKNGQIVGEGFHPRAGQPHAEVFALRQAAEQAKDATAYVTLEPCAHYGRTPPCAEALVKAGVKNVIIACLDPNPLVAGKGVAILENAGIAVRSGVCDEQARQLNLGFLKAMSSQMPYVRLKVASSLDGRTAMASGESKWITGEKARQDVQHWRAISGAVITGIQTVLADDCQLNVRALPNVELDQIVQPKRVILDRQGRLPLNAKILAQAQDVMVVGPFRQELADLGVTQFADQPLATLLQTLCQQHHIYDVLVEAGATLSTAFLQQGLVDEMIHYIAPTLLGQSARAMFQADFQTLAQQQRFRLKDVTQLGNDLRLSLTPQQESL
ncbi:bifunctional diaminohydroxyphosphoribosylaminopyrimidine deaminase/5-amino-6-(5-phosphoribosylamino)uracil reductase RibD [Acinetobacter sp.]|uniref:bifunctional diaminohydroxyphosphoribosylaminopyrimidine deaminase/5-amino-6-(5-phosphoribosylamino)uracil reductase RibD n=1 Tax=Acinetobacter sp. TaxID=472 RepID=UPI0031E280CE